MAGQQIYLEVISGDMKGVVAEFPVKKKITIGRTRVNAFQIKHDTVSQRHAFIANKDGIWFVTDTNSSNGTSINGVLVIPSVPKELRSGDLLGIGPENKLRININQVEEPNEEKKIDTGVPKELRSGNLLGFGPENKLRISINQVEEPNEEKKIDEEGLPSLVLTVKDWFEQEKKRLGDEITSKAEASVKKLVESSEALKKEICDAAGVEYTSISLKTR